MRPSLSRAFCETQCGRVHAIAKAGRLRPIIEDVTQMRIATRTGNRGARYEHGRVADLRHIEFRDRLPEARPAGAGIEFGPGVVERGVAADAAIESVTFRLRIFAGEGLFGISLARYRKGERLVALELRLPLRVCLHDFGFLHDANTFSGCAEILDRHRRGRGAEGMTRPHNRGRSSKRQNRGGAEKKCAPRRVILDGGRLRIAIHKSVSCSRTAFTAHFARYDAFVTRKPGDWLTRRLTCAESPVSYTHLRAHE